MIRTLVDMHCRAEYAGEPIAVVLGVGTAEGVRKEWDTRGRGRKAIPKAVQHIPIPKALAKEIKKAPKPGTKLTKGVAQWAKQGYETMKTDEKTLGKIETAKGRKVVLLKSLWFTKRLGDLMESWDGFKEAGKAVWDVVDKLMKVMIGAASAHEVITSMHIATNVLAPIVHHIAIVAAHVHGLFAEEA
jgi:hypothetical protein